MLCISLRLVIVYQSKLHKKAETQITGQELNPLAASFCFHDHEAQPEPFIKHFSGELLYGGLRALLYTVFLYKYKESIDEYETLNQPFPIRLLRMIFKRLIMYSFQKHLFLDVLLNRCFAKFTGKHLRWSLCNLILKRDSSAGVFL